MNPGRLALVSALLSAFTLAVVLLIAARPQPEPVDNTAAVLDRIDELQDRIDDLQAEFALVQQNVTDLRSLVEAGGDSGAGNQIVERLDRIEASVASAVAKVQAICGAIQSSPFAPSGFVCP